MARRTLTGHLLGNSEVHQFWEKRKAYLIGMVSMHSLLDWRPSVCNKISVTVFLIGNKKTRQSELSIKGLLAVGSRFYSSTRRIKGNAYDYYQIYYKNEEEINMSKDIRRRCL